MTFFISNFNNWCSRHCSSNSSFFCLLPKIFQFSFEQRACRKEKKP